MYNAKPTKYYSVQAIPETKSADVYIFGDITSWRWEENDVSAFSLVNEIKALDVDTINVHVDSYGGEVSEGWAIYNSLVHHKARIVTYADGFVASAALYPFLAGDERHASAISAFYLHEVMSGSYGYADDLRKAADDIDAMTEIGINSFVERAGMDAKKVRELMEAETWLAPSEALEYGIATDIISTAAGEGIKQSAKREIISRMLMKREKPAEKKTDRPITNNAVRMLGDLIQKI